MESKNLPVAIKAVGDRGGLDEGHMVAYAAIFDNIDSYGDRIVKGAFTKSLEGWTGGDRVMPLLYAHNMIDPHMNIGAISAAEEDDRGLKITAAFDLDNPTAAQVYRLVKSGRLSEMSFAFDAEDVEDVDGVRELRALKLYECSVVPIGANPDTEIVAVKTAAAALHATAADLKAGRAISAANETRLRDAADSMSTAIAAIEDVLPSNQDDDGSKSSPTAQEPSSGHGPTPEQADGSAAGKSGFNPSDLLVAEIQFLPQPETGGQSCRR